MMIRRPAQFVSVVSLPGCLMVPRRAAVGALRFKCVFSVWGVQLGLTRGAALTAAFILVLLLARFASTQELRWSHRSIHSALFGEQSPPSDVALAKGGTVMLDAWFNSQQRLNAAGQREYFHYKWNDSTDGGFSIFGSIFAGFGAKLDTLYTAPTLQKLKAAQYYIIVSPDIPAKNPHPHYIQAKDAQQVAEWVKQGGVLLLMDNDPANADIEHLDLIADRFGLHFNHILSHHVVDDDFAAGQISVKGGGPIFHDRHTIYMKDTCTLSIKPQAVPLLEDKGDIMMASVRYGRGTVVALVDPWLYNEYTDSRRQRPVQDNYAAGKEFVHWFLEQRKPAPSPTPRP